MSGSPVVATQPRLPDSPALDADAAARLRASNRRTALTLASIAVVFFFGIIASKFMGGFATGVSVVGAAVLLYLVVAIGRNLRSGK